MTFTFYTFLLFLFLYTLPCNASHSLSLSLSHPQLACCIQPSYTNTNSISYNNIPSYYYIWLLLSDPFISHPVAFLSQCTTNSDTNSNTNSDTNSNTNTFLFQCPLLEKEYLFQLEWDDKLTLRRETNKKKEQEQEKKEQALKQKSKEEEELIKQQLIEKELEKDHKHFDFASESAEAKVIKHSANLKGASRLLEGNPDKYMMVPCSEPSKWVVIQLSEDIKCTSISFSNLEHYSSGFQHLQVLGSDRYPTPRWILLNNITAQDSSEQQAFPILDQAWIRYIKVRFLSHFNDHHFCTMTSLHAFGLRVLEDLEEGIRGLDPNSAEEWDEENGVAGITGAPAVEMRRESIFKRLTHRISTVESDQCEFKKIITSQLEDAVARADGWRKEMGGLLDAELDGLQDAIEQSRLSLASAVQGYDLSVSDLKGMRRELEALEEQVRTVEVLIIGLLLVLVVLFLLFIFSMFCLDNMHRRSSELVISPKWLVSSLEEEKVKEEEEAEVKDQVEVKVKKENIMQEDIVNVKKEETSTNTQRKISWARRHSKSKKKRRRRR